MLGKLAGQAISREIVPLRWVQTMDKSKKHGPHVEFPVSADPRVFKKGASRPIGPTLAHSITPAGNVGSSSLALCKVLSCAARCLGPRSTCKLPEPILAADSQ